jgi:hypothetical protein
VAVSEEEREIVVEAKTGSLYDLFKERWASGACSLRSPKPVAFYWAGAWDSDAA